MALTKSEIIELYTATFNRAADADGVAYWLTQELTQTEMANSFIASAEAVALYPTTQTTTEYVEAIYANLFGHAADAEGLAYWVGQLDGGTVAKESMVVAVVNGALGTDQTTLDNRTAVSTKYVDGSSNATDVSLASVTDDAATVTAANTTADTAVAAIAAAATAAAEAAAAAAAAAAAVGETITFTTAIDTLTGTSGNDNFVGDAATLTTADQIAGGAGTDTAKLYDVAAQSDIPTMDSIENIQLINATGDVSVASTGATGITVNNLTTLKTVTVAADQMVTLSNLASNDTQDITTTAADATVDLTLTGIGIVSDASTLLDINGAGVSTINVTATGTAAYLDDLTADTALTTLNIAGDVDFTITNTFATATAINITNTAKTTVTTGVAQAVVTGGAGADWVTMTHTAASSIFSASTGAGDDKITLGANALADLLDNKVTVSGGEGTDTIAVSSVFGALISGATALTMAPKGIANDFEAIEINSVAVTTDAVNATSFGSNIASVDYSAGLGDAQTLTNLASGSTVVLGAAAATATDSLTVTVKDSATAGNNTDTLNLKLDGAHAGGTLDYGVAVAANVETINIESTSTKATALVLADTNTVDVTIANAVTVNVTGNVAAILGTALTGASLQTVDASTNTGGLTVTTAGAAQGITIKGSTKADSITTGAGTDSITGGTGADSFEFATAASIAGTALDVITDFENNSDKINFTGDEVVLAADVTTMVATSNVNTTAGGLISFAEADDTYAEMVVAIQADTQLDVALSVALFQVDGNTYVYFAGASTAETDDQIVQLTGVTGTDFDTITDVSATALTIA